MQLLVTVRQQNTCKCFVAFCFLYLYLINSAFILLHEPHIIFVNKNILVVEILEMNVYDGTCILNVFVFIAVNSVFLEDFRLQLNVSCLV